MPRSSPLGNSLVTDLSSLHVHIDSGTSRRASRLPFTLPALDQVLDGGLPRGAITEIVGRTSSGRTTLGYSLIASATRSGEYVAWVDVPNALDPESAREAGANVERVLWLHPRDRLMGLRAVEHVLSAGGFGLVVLDLEGPSERWSVPASVWMRMARAAVHRDAAIVILAASSHAGSFAALSLEVQPLRPIFEGQNGPCPVFEGAASTMYLRRRKFGPPGGTGIDLVASTGV